MTATFHAIPEFESQPLVLNTPQKPEFRSAGATPSHLNRNSRLTRSLCTNSQTPSSNALQRGQAARESFMNRERRRVSLERREKQLNDWTKECSKYMDAMLETSEELKERERENEALRNENDQLKDRLEDLQKELEDYKRCNLIQQEQLSLFRQRTAQSRSEAEKFKVENMILSSGNASIESYERMVQQHQQLQSDMETMMRKSRETQAIIDQLQEENNSLRERLVRQEAKSKHGGHSEDDKVDPRTKRELLRVIRHAKEEKVKWESYSEDLLRSIVTRAPQVLDIRVRNNVEHCCPDEARWEAFSLSLVQKVMENHPELLESVRTPTETDHEKLAHSRRAKVVSIV